jgi:hypothetical protein
MLGIPGLRAEQVLKIYKGADIQDTAKSLRLTKEASEKPVATKESRRKAQP